MFGVQDDVIPARSRAQRNGMSGVEEPEHGSETDASLFKDSPDAIGLEGGFVFHVWYRLQGKTEG